MRWPTERRWVPWLNGARRTTSHSTSKRPRSWWWISGDRAENTHPSPSTRHLWSGWAALSSSACHTSLRISHGLLTPDAVLKKAHQRLFLPETAEEVWNEPRILRSFYFLHCGEHPARHRLLEVSFPPSRTSYTRRCTRKARRIIKDSSHPSHSLLSLCCPQGDVSAASDPALADWGTAFSSGYQVNEQSEITHPTSHSPPHTTCHALHLIHFYWITTHILH